MDYGFYALMINSYGPNSLLQRYSYEKEIKALRDAGRKSLYHSVIHLCALHNKFGAVTKIHKKRFRGSKIISVMFIIHSVVSYKRRTPMHSYTQFRHNSILAVNGKK
jgi:hypothetical protein